MKIINGRRGQILSQWETLMAEWERELREIANLETEWTKCELLLKKMPKERWPQLPYSTDFLKKAKKEWQVKKAKMASLQKRMSVKLYGPRKPLVLSLVKKRQE